MDKGGVDHTVSPGRATAETVEIFKVAMQHLGARGGEGFSADIRAGKAENLMSGRKQLPDNGGADKTGRTGDKDTHGEISRCLLTGADMIHLISY